VLKWAGAAYLVWLGIKLWRAPVSLGAEGVAPTEGKPFRIFAHAYVVTALNPKSIVFFVAFQPQFLDVSQPVLPQMAIFEATFLVLGSLNALFYALLASAARKTIRKPSVQKVVNRTGGTLLIGAGLLTIGLKRAAA
jgi:threonine/homoserine/homoserine lactone efflux protein